MCHNSLSEPCPHLVRWLMGISIIGFPITTLLTSPPLLTPHPQNTTRPKQIRLEQMSNTIRLRSKQLQTWPTLSLSLSLLQFPRDKAKSLCGQTRKLGALIVAWRRHCAPAATQLMRVHKWEQKCKVKHQQSRLCLVV